MYEKGRTTFIHGDKGCVILRDAAIYYSKHVYNIDIFYAIINRFGQIYNDIVYDFILDIFNMIVCSVCRLKYGC